MAKVNLIATVLGSVTLYLASAVSCSGHGKGSSFGLDGGAPSVDVPEASAEEAGSRLRPIYENGSDGSRAAVAGLWWDSQLQTECRFESVGESRYCLPAVRGARYDGENLFTDAGCKSPTLTLGMSTCGQAPKFVFDYSADLCGTNPKATWVAEEFTAPLYEMADGYCRPYENTTGARFWLLQIDPAPLSTFVESTLSHD